MAKKPCQLEAFKLILGDQVFRCKRANVNCLSDLFALVSQRTGISAPAAAAAAQPKLQLTPVQPETFDHALKSDADLNQLIEDAESNGLKVARLNISFNEVSIAEDSKLDEQTNTQGDFACHKCKVPGQSLNLDAKPFFVCLFCQPNLYICKDCENDWIHIHPTMKLSSRDHVEALSRIEVKQPQRKPSAESEAAPELEPHVEKSLEKVAIPTPVLRSSVSLPMMKIEDNARKLQAQFVSFAVDGVKPGSMVESGTVFLAGWRVRNNGSIQWGPNLVVVHEKGDPIEVLDDVDSKNLMVPSLAVLEEGEIVGRFVAPSVRSPRFMQCFFRIKRKDTGECFGQRLKLEIDVIPASMSLLERQYRRIEQLGFKDRKMIEQCMSEADGNIERAVLLLLKRTNSSHSPERT